MPEIWLNYGITDVVLDIRAENLDQHVESGGTTINDNTIHEKLGGLDLAKPMELVILHNSPHIQKIISLLFALCEQKSLPFPKIFSNKKTMGRIRAGLPEGSLVSEFNSDLSAADLVFVGEAGFDGLFGYETVSTRLIRQFGLESMSSAYAARKADTPTPGQMTGSFAEAKKFVDNFEIKAIDIVSGSAGIVDLAVGHPSETSNIVQSLESFAVKDVKAQRSIIVSTGREASSESMTKSLSSLWNCSASIKKDGLVVLVSECAQGLGSDSLRQYIEGRLSADALKDPTRYVDGMENLLYLNELQQNFQTCIVSVLPESYIKRLDMISLPGIKQAMDHIIATLGQSQKIMVVSDGAGTLLRYDAGR